MDTFETLLPILDSDTPDWSPISIQTINFAINQALERLAANRLTRAGLNDPLYRQKMEGYLRQLFAAKARKWGERGGGDAVWNQIQKTRLSIATAEHGKEWYEMYLTLLQQELESIEAPKESTQ